jgi:hypothetical protein
MFPDYPPARVSSLPASHRRSSPRALCLLHPDVRAAADWSHDAVSLAALGERGADPHRASEHSRGRRHATHCGRTTAPAPRCGLAGGLRELLAWLEQRHLGPDGLGSGLCFRLDVLALDGVLPRLRDDLEIPLAEQRWLIELWLRGERVTHFQRLGLAPTVDQAAIRRGYLATCQRLHPDRYYGKHIGRFAALLVELFHRAHVAQAYLADPRRCARYVALLAAAGHVVGPQPADATPSPTAAT